MTDSFSKGIAFIVEGDTEKEFYLSLLAFLCQKHSAILVKFNVVGTITQIPHSGKWFNTQCVDKYGNKHGWVVFLCYDTDDYKNDISKFYKGDWATLRTLLKKATAIIDIAAATDIEDIMLQDLAGICRYLGCGIPSGIHGRKGKVKIKNIFRDNGQTYHEGKRARKLIDTLNMQKIIDSEIVPLLTIEHIIFG